VTAKLNPPLLTAGQSELLLDQVMFEHVAECVNLDGIYQIERLLEMQLRDLGVVADQAHGVAVAIIDRALLRLSGHVRSYVNAADWPTLGCELCEAEADDDDNDPGSSGKRGRARRPHASVRLDS
jgi:hypothetical protein